MWTVEQILNFDQLPLSDQLWLIALAVEENGGPSEYFRALRTLAERLQELGWWLDGGQPATSSSGSKLA